MTSIPSVARISYCSFSLISGSLSFNPSSLYFIPLVLKKRFSKRPLLLCHSSSSSAVGLSSMICLASNAAPLSSSHFLAFLHVVHFGYSKNSTPMSYLLLLSFHFIETTGWKNTARPYRPARSPPSFLCRASLPCALPPPHSYRC
ncbi:hypothetical protein LAJLEIBI_00210 [[Clostridium] hylemonae DSM 15053]|nr:hypothetical protein LAJLEIBI_00210 [[Clostridium] hylemonae DSM 15053]